MGSAYEVGVQIYKYIHRTRPQKLQLKRSQLDLAKQQIIGSAKAVARGFREARERAMASSKVKLKGKAKARSMASWKINSKAKAKTTSTTSSKVTKANAKTTSTHISKATEATMTTKTKNKSMTCRKKDRQGKPQQETKMRRAGTSQPRKLRARPYARPMAKTQAAPRVSVRLSKTPSATPSTALGRHLIASDAVAEFHIRIVDAISSVLDEVHGTSYEIIDHGASHEIIDHIAESIRAVFDDFRKALLTGW